MGAYGAGGVIEYVERNNADEMDRDNEGDWKEQLAFFNSRFLPWSDGYDSVFVDDVYFCLLAALFRAGGSGNLGARRAPALEP